MLPGVQPTRIALVLSILVTGILFGAANALGADGGLLPVAPRSPNASGTSDLYVVVVAICLVGLVVIEGALAAIVIRYRRRARSRYADGPQIRGSLRLHAAPVVVTALAMTAVAVVAIVKLPGIIDTPAAGAAGETSITVEGRQFYWLFRYPGGGVSVGTMVAPAGVLVHESVVSPVDDVVHGWFVPALGGSVAAVPGETHEAWFRAPAGSYVARCTELCGIQHTRMTARVKVVSPDEYAQFIESRAANQKSVEVGREEYAHVCATCHRLDTVFIGPALGANPILSKLTDLTSIVRNGVGTMPAVGSDWTDEQIEALAAYTATIVKPA